MAPLEIEIPFWFSERNPGASQSDLESTERHVGFQLPEKFKELLTQQNGGVSNFTAFDNGATYAPVLPILGASPEGGFGSMIGAFQVREDFEVPESIVVFAAQGESWLGFDYRERKDEPSVVFRMDFDREVEQVAASFDLFLDGLIEE